MKLGRSAMHVDDVKLMSNDYVRRVLLSTATSDQLLFLDLVWFPATTEPARASIDAEDKRYTSQHQWTQREKEEASIVAATMVGGAWDGSRRGMGKPVNVATGKALQLILSCLQPPPPAYPHRSTDTDF
uniref:Uncharacterized protein n=1 Tax=Arundo donax TaxID=35708 RepID=A0A0A9D7B4_ARUDO